MNPECLRATSFYDMCFFAQVSFRMMIYATANYISMYYINILIWNQHGCCLYAFFCAQIVHDNKLFPTRKRLAFHTWAVDSFQHQHFWKWSRFLFDFFNVLDQIWREKDQNEMKLLGTVCQRIHYFPGKQGVSNRWESSLQMITFSWLFPDI